MREVGADEARRAGDLGGELGEALLGDRVAVDRDQRAGRADAVGDEARVAAAAERAVDRDLAGLRVERSISSPARTGMWVRVMSSRMAKDAVRSAARWEQVAVVRVPGGAVPDLEAVAGAGDDDLWSIAGVLEQARGSITRPAASSSVSVALP